MKNWERERAALVIAHPGHELLIHHWLERARPVTFVLTDGSGHTDRGRIESTTALLDRVGARRGSIYGALSDRRLYRTILDRKRDVFTDLVRQLAESLQREGVTYVVGDAVEGVNPGHDVCRLLLNAALQLLENDTGIHPRNLEYPVERPPNECPVEDRPEAIFLELDDDAYQRKVDAARAYSALAQEMNQMLAHHKNANAFRVECLRPVRYGLEIADRFAHPCLYEWYGEKQVAAGIYREVIRFRDHIAPLAEHLKTFSSRPSLPI
ncbi:MAG: hypothetical protein WCE79_25335 [Xanthobacteraceae bacterium]